MCATSALFAMVKDGAQRAQCIRFQVLRSPESIILKAGAQT